jgi:hypothetical protein
MQRDPLGYVDGMNLYEYCSSNSIQLVDPVGLIKLPCNGSTTNWLEDKGPIKPFHFSFPINKNEYHDGCLFSPAYILKLSQYAKALLKQLDIGCEDYTDKQGEKHPCDSDVDYDDTLIGMTCEEKEVEVDGKWYLSCICSSTGKLKYKLTCNIPDINIPDPPHK